MAYHAGELEVQRRAGEEDLAARLLRGVRTELPDPARDFLEAQRLLVVASIHGDDVWASILHGPPGFVTTPDERTVLAQADDPRIMPGPVGLLALEPATRRRMRVNGHGEHTPAGLRVGTEQVYSNCPKYIQRREIVAEEEEAPRHTATESTALSHDDRALIARADTFFIASAAHGGADASHRGGSPGFVTTDGNRLTFPDYTGNSMYMSLGNLVANPRIGLLFLDFETGDTLQLTGAAELELEPRAVHVTVERAVRTPGALPYRWVLLERSRFNP
jgi:hypothetical protein